ncbi:MAG: PPC domain-containing protein [Planctomycetes bacterium]|nr:PPC domain-containing protein [Planctomycetota bacterium]
MTRALIREGFRLPLVGCLLLLMGAHARGQSPNPVLNTVYPPGGQAGTSAIVVLDGTGLDGLRDVRSVIPKLSAKKLDGNRFQLDIPTGTPTGVYDLRAVGTHGMSSPRSFVVGNRTEVSEAEPNDTFDTAQDVPLDIVVNGRVEKPGDVDCFRFKAKAGQRVVLDCSAERIDSKLRAVLEVCDADGKRLAVSRGYTVIDPLVDFLAPADGIYYAKVFDLSYLGSTAHFYRLEIDTKPRVEFAVPCAVTRGKTAKVKLYGRNLAPREVTKGGPALDGVEVEITPPEVGRHGSVPLRLRSAQMALDCFAYHYPGGHAPVLMAVTDVPVVVAAANHASDRAQEVAVPSEVCGQLTDGDERHWYAVRVRRGEVLWLESFAARMGSPVDLDVRVLDPDGKNELLELAPTLENLGGARFATAHPDPAGRWVAPADGRYLIQVRNLTGGLNRDPRRLYRLSVRREEPDFHLAAVSRRPDQPAGLNLMAGGREMLEVLAVRHRGMSGPIRVTAENLPPGIQCSDVWIGPGQDRGIVVLSANRDCPPFAGGLNLTGRADVGGTTITRPAKGGAMIWPGQPVPSGRITQEIPLATTSEAPLLLTATPAETAVDQESVLDVAVDLEQRFEGATGLVHLTAVGLPRSAGASVATIPAGKTKGWISLAFPAALPPGPYTFAVRAETTVPVAGAKGAKSNPVAVTVVSNPITVTVRPARIVLEIDPRTPTKIARGKIIQLHFTAERKHGFIGKVHTELVAPGGVVGLRARGVTLVGQSDSGTLQVIATEDAPLGRHLFLRLDAVGTVEDQPRYRASRFVELEITE